MKKIWTRIVKWWYFHIANPVVRKGESGGFRWTFRRFWLDIATVSGNFKVRFIADENPYGYLAAGNDDTNIHGFALTMYEIGKLLTTDQGFVDDVQKAIVKYRKRLEKKAAGEVVNDETEDKIALETEKAIHEHVELPKKERRKVERDVNGRFKKAVKDVQEGADSNL